MLHFLCIFPKISLDSNSNSIDIVTKFHHIKVGFLTVGHSQKGNLINLMLITAFLTIFSQRSPGSLLEVGSLRLAECLVGFEPGIVQFRSQRLNTLDHSLKVAFEYQSVLSQVLSKTSRLKGIYNHSEVKILLL